MITFFYKFTVLCTYIFEELVAHMLFSSAFKKKYEHLKYFIFIFLSYILLFIIYSLDDILLNLISFISINLLFSSVVYEGKFIKKIYYTMFFTLVMIVTEVVALFILKAIFATNFSLSEATIIVLAVISKSLLFLLIKLFCNVVNENSNKIPTQKFVALMLISSTIVTVLYVIASLTLNLLTDTIKHIELLLSAVGLMFSIMLIFYMFEKSIKEQIDIKEFSLLKQKSELEHKHYNIIKENFENIKIIEHDIKRHLRLINEYAKKENNLEIIKYLESLNDNLISLSHKHISNNKALDIVLNEKIHITKNKNIEFNLNVQNINLEFIDDVDICTIFSNILDNAIESCEKSINKDIILDIFIVNNKFLTIEISNSCDTSPIEKNGELISQKENTFNHGYGIKGVKKVIKKYEGQLFYFYDEKESKFITNISIPIKWDIL